MVAPLPAPTDPPTATTDPAVALTDAALRAAASRLETIAMGRARVALAARVDWSGSYRQRFDAERAARDAVVAGVIACCRLAAGS